MQVLDHGIEVECLELFGVVEILAHRIGQRRIAMEHLDVQRVRPPVAIGVSALAAGERALARALVVSLFVHGFLRSVFGPRTSIPWTNVKTAPDKSNSIA